MVVPVQIPKPLVEKETLSAKESVESIVPVETQPIAAPTPALAQPKNPEDSEQLQVQSAQKPVPNVVEKTHEKVKLHKLNSPDTLTTIADKEEEEFISEVEAAHEQHP